MDSFDIYAPELPSGTMILEASAGTGKTFTVAALVARYVAEGVATLGELLVITFGRAASQELRERVRDQIREAERGLVEPAVARRAGGLVEFLTRAPDGTPLDDDEVALRQRRLAAAIADFDGATIATTHEFCRLVLRSLGVAGDTDSHARLVDDLDDLVVEVVDDLYLARFGSSATDPPFSRPVALTLGRRAVNVFRAPLEPADTPPGSVPGLRRQFAEDVRAEVDRRMQRLGVLSFDDLLGRLADALEPEESAARDRMRRRWRVVLVDEFQDTDPVQWSVLHRAFTAHATLVLIGDPKQAIYAFRGGDVFSYLDAVRTAERRSTLGVNWRSDAPLVDALQVLTHGAALGDPEITVLPVSAAPGHEENRLVGAPQDDPVRLRHVRVAEGESTAIGELRKRIALDLAADVAELLDARPTYDGAPLKPGDVAILVQTLRHIAPVRDALTARGIASVITGGSSVLLSDGGDEWLCLLEAMEQPQRAGRVRAVALTALVGATPTELDTRGDALTDDVAERVRTWLDLFRGRGIAAVFEAITSEGLGQRVLGRPHGERLMTDLNHVAQILHEAARRDRLGLPALLAWFRAERRAAASVEERSRRLDTDASAVQIVTIHGSKGLQYPIVYLPHAFNRWVPPEKDTLVYHDTDRRRILDVGGAPDSLAIQRARAEDAGEELRLTYVALTRAQSQVVAWWAPSADAKNSGLSRLLLGRRRHEGETPLSLPVIPAEDQVVDTFLAWQREGGLSYEEAQVRSRVRAPSLVETQQLGVRRFIRSIDTDWRRTSYSGLIRAEEQLVTTAVDVEPEVPGTVDEEQPDEEVAVSGSPGPDQGGLLSPMNDLPAGATFGSLVHAVLEHADPQAPDLVAELRSKVHEELRWWSVDATPDQLAEALVPMQLTPLGPLAANLRLVDIGLADRLRELDFEFPLAGGDRPDDALPEVHLREIGDVLRRHLAPDDPMRSYADRLESPSLGGQLLRGYLSGSIDVVLRVPHGGTTRYVVVDYKTNKLGDPERPLTALDYTGPLMTEAMLHSHYPLQALLYSVVLHRYLRWRLGSTSEGYDPERHLGGILYLYVRGMCGAETPVVDGQPCGVFAWQPPAAMIVELSGLLAGVSTPVGAQPARPAGRTP
ncbi:MAG: UvrD-helicase domain-containing protein [Marmoricola sp.]